MAIGGQFLFDPREDVAEIFEEIAADYRRRCVRDKQLLALTRRIQNGADFDAAYEYAERMADDLSKTYKDFIKAHGDEFAEHVEFMTDATAGSVKPMLSRVYEGATQQTTAIRRRKLKRAGFDVSAVEAPFPEDRIDDLARKIIESQAEGLDVDALYRWLTEPLINNAEAFVDDAVKQAKKDADDLGFYAIVRRKTHGNACSWCQARAGEYEDYYSAEVADAFRRHEYCRCTLTVDFGGAKQDAWSKQTWYG